MTVDAVGVERAHFARYIKKNALPFLQPQQVTYIVQEELEQIRKITCRRYARFSA